MNYNKSLHTLFISRLKKIIPSLLMMGFIICLPYISFGQLDPGNDPNAPIDGGLSMLIAAGVGIGAKKVIDARKRKEETKD